MFTDNFKQYSFMPLLFKHNTEKVKSLVADSKTLLGSELVTELIEAIQSTAERMERGDILEDYEHRFVRACIEGCNKSYIILNREDKSVLKSCIKILTGRKESLDE